MARIAKTLLGAAALVALAACTARAPAEPEVTRLALFPNETPQLRTLVNKYADEYEVPRTLVHRVIQRESDYRPGARNGPYYGLMQILPATARGMGFQGSAGDLLDAETNLRWAVKYLRGAWMLSDGDEGAAVMHYARGYYYAARDRCMLVETGLLDREIRKNCPPPAPVVEVPQETREQVAEATSAPLPQARIR